MKKKGKKLLSQELEEIRFFKDKYEAFSNFYPVVIHYEGLDYPSVEHAFISAKSLDTSFRLKISSLPGDKAGIAKRMGRNIKLRNNWELIKLSIMKQFLIQKFNYEEFKTLLLSTDGVLLTEGNYWHDNYWGDCFCKKCKSIPGQNNLGKLLMKVRNIVKLKF